MVTRQPEPVGFEENVRKPGRLFLIRIPAPKGKQWKNHEYWRRIMQELRDRYSGVCAYACHWISPDTGFGTVEHFKPKRAYPNEAYEWTNYRYVCGRLNGRKKDFEDVLDPFEVQNGWFQLDFPSMQIFPDPQLPEELRKRVNDTIKRLKLNSDHACVTARKEWVLQHCKYRLGPEFLKRRAPFIAMEIERQGLENSIHQIMTA